MGARPSHPVTATDMLLDCVLDELQAQGATLKQILDRLPVPDRGAGSPVPAEPQPITIAEPAPEPPPARKAPAKKATKTTRR